MADVDTLGEAADRVGADHHLLGEGAGDGRPHDPVAHGDVTHAVRHLRHHAGELAAGHERRRDRELVLVRHQQHVGEVHGRGLDAHPHLPRPDRRDGQVVDLHDLGWARHRQTAAHVSGSGAGGGGAINGPSTRAGASRRRPGRPPGRPRWRRRPSATRQTCPGPVGAAAASRTSSFEAATPSGPLAAMRSARARAASRTSSGGTTLLTSPSSWRARRRSSRR